MGLYIRTLESFSLSLLALLMRDGDLQWGDNKWLTLPHTIPHHFQCLSCSVSYHTSCKPI